MYQGDRRILKLLCLLLLLIPLFGCSVHIDLSPENTAPLSSAEAQELLERVFVGGHDVDAGTVRASVGILLPKALSAEALEASITGTDINGSPVDLLGDEQLSSEEWFVISDLEQYAELTLALRYLQDGEVIAERTVDLLHFESEE